MKQLYKTGIEVVNQSEGSGLDKSITAFTEDFGCVGKTVKFFKPCSL